jgi:putative ABC transport system permease protein
MRRAAIAGTGAAATVALALLVMVCAFVAVAVPRASLGYRTDVLQGIFHSASAAQRSVFADGHTSGAGLGRLTASELEFAGGRLAAGLRRDGLPLASPRSQWSTLATGSALFTGFRWQVYGRELGPPTLQLLYSSALARQATLAAGSFPDSVRPNGSSATFEIAVTAATAAKFGLHTGSVLHYHNQALVVSGILRPRGTNPSFWQLNSTAAKPLLLYPTPQSTPYLDGTAFVGADEVESMQSALADLPVHVIWDFPLDLSGVNADQAASLARAQAGIASLPVAGVVSEHLTQTAENESPLVIDLTTGMLAPLQSFVATDDDVQRTLSLLFVSLAAIAAVVVLLGARLVTEYRRAEFSLMRARGASLRQIGKAALAGSVAAALPAAAVAVAGATAATPGPASSLAWWLAGVITATALAGPPLLAMWSLRTRRRAARAMDPAARRRIAVARRWVIDGTLVCGAAGGLVILRLQGLPPPGSVDLFTSAAPVLAAIPVAVLVMRCYPLVLRQLTRLAQRRPGVVMVVGFARGSDTAGAGVLPAFALVLALAVTAFAAMARDAVASASSLASWQATGADAVVNVPASKARATAATLPLARRVPGVTAVTTVTVTSGQSDQGLPVTVVVVDPRRYAAFTVATPYPRFPAAALARPAGASPPPAGPVPVLVSPAARASLSEAVADQGTGLIVAGRDLRLKIAGTVTGIAGARPGSGFVVLPEWAVPTHRPPPNVIAVAGPHLDSAALSRAVGRALPGARITLRSRVLAAISRAPLPHGGFITFAQGSAAAGGFALLVLALTLVLTARSRQVTLARLTTMGLDAAQSRRIATAEILPAILAAAIGGSVCAVVLVPLAGPALDLAAFTGTPVRVPLHASPLALALTLAGLCVLAALALGVQDRLAHHRGTTQALRVGE